ncbi:MAG: hypothetical protein DHS20C10_01690 [marine bacterium B5-7]|nr:MAG: hypothetical protein DHS20C10_01690 [marine bacterium B5-7]
MSAPMKKHHINASAKIMWQGGHYSVPTHVLEKYLISPERKSSDYVDAEAVFSDLIEKYGEAGITLRGLRTREGLSQVKFAEIVGITQQNLSAMENGRRGVGKALAKRIAAKFDLDYRWLL